MPNGGPSPPGTVSALLLLVTVFHVLAFSLTSFRLSFRYHMRRLWWDDFWAALALLCDAVCMVTGWIISAPLNDPYTNIESLPTAAQSLRSHIISYWLTIVLFTCSLWFSRVSIVFSLVRIIPPARSISMIAFWVFVCMWTYILTAKSAVCAMDRSWYDILPLQCHLPPWVALSEVCTDTVSDVILVILPFRWLWHVKLPSKQRIMVLSVFSTSILVSVVSAVHTAYLIPSASFIGGITADIEGAVSLIVCNLLVIVTFIYRVIRNDREFAADHPFDKNTRSSNHLTTVDLDLSGFTATSTQGTRTCTSGSRFTGSHFTATDVSSLQFANVSDKETSFGSVVATSETVVTASRAVGPPVVKKT